jgi:hypothetical protein
MPAHDSVAAPEALLNIDQVHRTTLALADTCRLSKHLGHYLAGIGADGKGMAMVAVGSDDVITLFAGANRTYSYSLLPDVQMQKATDLALLVQFGASLLKAANEHHLPVPL